jgi:hypothetical protein
LAIAVINPEECESLITHPWCECIHTWVDVLQVTGSAAGTCQHGKACTAGRRPEQRLDDL